MLLLALDLSVKATGFAVGDENSPRPRAGVWRLPRDPDDWNRALASLRLSLMSLLRQEQVTAVVCESAILQINRYYGAKQAYKQICLEGVAREACQTFGVRSFETIAPQTWRKAFLGDPRPERPKQVCQARCHALGWPFDPTLEDCDDCEACGLWTYEMMRSHPEWKPNGGRYPASLSFGPQSTGKSGAPLLPGMGTSRD